MQTKKLWRSESYIDYPYKLQCKVDECAKQFLPLQVCARALLHHESMHDFDYCTLVYKDLLQCDECYAWLNSERKLNMHKNDHIQMDTYGTQYTYKCPKCPFCFKTPEALLWHMQTECRTVSAVCPRCDKRCTTDYDIKEHCRDVCPPWDTQLIQYMNRNWIRDEHTCKTCWKIFDNPKALSDHKEMHKLVVGFQCDQCFDMFDSRQSRDEHVASGNHYNGKCGECNKVFSNKKDFYRCEFEHTKIQDQQTKCTPCQEYFTRLNVIHHATLVHHFQVNREIVN